MKSFFLIVIFQLFITMIFASETCKLVAEGANGKTEIEVSPGQCQKVPNGGKITVIKLDGTSNGGFFEVYKNSKNCKGSSISTKESLERESFFKVGSVRVSSC